MAATLRRHGGREDYGIAVRVDANDAVIVAATVINTNTAEDIAVAKYNASGGLQWRQDWDGSGLMDFPTSMILDGSGNIYVAGASTTSTTATDYTVLKYSDAGALQWSSAYNYVTNLQDYATSIVLNGSGDPVVTGASAASATVWEYATVVYNSSTGVQSAVNRVGFPGIGIDEPSAIAKDASGNIIVVGTADSSGNKNIRTLTFSPSLVLLWSQSYDGSGLEDKGLSVGVTATGDVYVAGYTEKDAGVTDFITLKYDASGSLLWERAYQSAEPAGSAKASQLSVTPTGGCKVVGAVTVAGGDAEARAISYNADGELEWEGTYNTPGMDGATSVLLDGNAVYVSGITQGLAGNNYATVRYSVYRDTNPYHLDSNGKPDYVDHEVIIRFRPQVVNQAFVSNRDLQFAKLHDVIPSSVINEMSAALGVDLNEHRSTVLKIHRWMTPADSISISRLGDTVRLDKFWASFVVTLPVTLDVKTASTVLDHLSSIINYAEPNYLAQPASVPNDSLFSTYQAGMIPNTSYPNSSINLDSAWNIVTGDSSIRVGVYDAPIYWKHRDFGGPSLAHTKIKGGYDYYNTVTFPNYADSNYSHGTAVAGIIGAIRNNGRGIAGVAGGDFLNGNRGVSLYSMGLFIGPSLFVQSARVAEALNEGVINPNYAFDIINCSFYYQVGTHELRQAVKNVTAHHCVLVAARGNDGSEAFTYPTSFHDNLTISVGANDIGGSTSSLSNFGHEMDVIAPGVKQLVAAPITVPFDPSLYVIHPGYSLFNGTSAATPHVTGVAALMMSRHRPATGAPNRLSQDDIEYILSSTATDIDDTVVHPSTPGYDKYSGWGRVNATAAVRAVDYPHRYVRHSGQPISRTVSQPLQNVDVLFLEDDTLISGGDYVCDRYTITETYITTLPQGHGVVALWPRYSSSSGGSSDTIANDNNDRYCEITATINQNTCTVTAKTYVYYVKHPLNSPLSAINMFWPCDTSQAKAAYSVHASDTPIAAAIVPVKQTGTFVLFPNPTTDAVSLRYSGAALQDPAVSVTDLLGRPVYFAAFSGVKDTLSLSFPTNSLSSGVYFCRLLSKNRLAMVQKFSKY